ncbi:uncharacterized protein [Chelonus insularis]|uniref:uncharacterized protein isoform X2 n=1 Tax=Chelonus insularis TaxID=460826 RepID=UPI00158E7F35|nr:uncharacterized protein LOC118069368 isoform X2 [Chelonus insularis]
MLRHFLLQYLLIESVIMARKIIYLSLLINNIIVYFGSNLVNCQIRRIPQYLEECYLNETFYGPQLPLTLPIFIDIVRKIEAYSHDTMDLRTLTSSMLHRFKFDGIEFHKNINFKPGILPFGGTGSQRTKNEIVNKLIPGSVEIFPDHSLSLLERCTLHRILSNTISEAESPQTDQLCAERPTEKILGSENIRQKKICPTEQGVILTPFKTVTLGSIIAAMAAALQHQNVAVKLLFDTVSSSANSSVAPPHSDEFNEEVDIILPRNQMLLNKSMSLNSLINSDVEVDNIWLATIAGFWNSTMRPQIYYLVQTNDDFDVTRAEIIGAIDGFIIAKHLKTWLSLFNNLRLSQILDMYYSSRGFLSDSVGACKRKYAFWPVASRTILEEQVFAASQLLAYKRSVAHMTNEALKEITTYAVKKFTNYVNNHLFPEINCPKDKIYPRAEIFVIFDGAWSREYTADFFAVLLEDLNISKFGSKIGFLHGTTAEWLLNITDSPSRVHEEFISQLNSIFWPTYLNFMKNFQLMKTYLTEKWAEKQRNHSIGSLSQVLIFLTSQGIQTEHDELDQMINSMKDFKESHPDVNLLYYTSEKHSESLKKFLISEEDHVIDTLKINDISRKLLEVPKSIRPALCNPNVTNGIRDQVEDYIKPQEVITYRLDPQWRIRTKQVITTVTSFAYGTLEICSWSQMRNSVKKNNFKCGELSGHSEMKLMDFFNCKKNFNCPAMFYQIRGIISQKKCAEIDCKSPDYIRFLLRLENLQCSSAKILLSNLSIIFLLFLFIYFL